MTSPYCAECRRSTSVGGCAAHGGSVTYRDTATFVIGGTAPPPPRQFGPCSKCGWDDIGVSYHPGHPMGCTEWTCRMWRRTDEHLSLFCRHCQYRWLEDALAKWEASK